MAELTPVDQLFVYHIFGTPEDARRWVGEPDSYRLSVTGLVNTQSELSLATLREQFEPVTIPLVLQCMTNVHWGRVEFTGARLRDVLAAARPRPEARKAAFFSADGYTTDLTLQRIGHTDEPVLLAYAMNGEPIPLDHGYPIRVASPGKYGYKWPKWLTKLEIVDRDFRGHYEGRRGWSDDAERGQPVT